MQTVFIDPGRFSSELVLEEEATASDGVGGHSQSWHEVAIVFAQVEPVATQNVFAAGQAHEYVTHRITMRYRDDVRSGMRLRKQQRAMVIVSIRDVDETGRYLVCQVREVGR